MGQYTVRSRRQWFLSSRHRSCSGATMLWAIAFMIVLGSLAAAIVSMSPSSMQEKLAGERSAAAYYASISGLNYTKSIAALAAAGAYGEGWALSNLNGTYSVGNDTEFVLSVTGASSPYTVSSRGVVQSGSGNEANYELTNSMAYAPYVAPPPPFTPKLEDYNFNNPTNRPDYAKYSDDQTRDFPAGLDDHDITTKNFIVGKDYHYGFGNIWFAGDRAGVSELGVSSFANGFRIFFTFMFTTNIGDGFVVSVLNASNNNYGSCGGDSAEGGLIGYAGDSRVYDSATGVWSNRITEFVDQSGLGKGLHPPKFGIEIDTYINSGGSWDPNSTMAECTNDNGLMNDLASGSGGGHHVGIDYWGTGSPYLRKTCYGPGSGFDGDLNHYSDVRHGSGDNASNNSNGNSALKYFTFNTNTTYYFRMDVSPSGQNYTIKTWVAKCSSSESQCSQQIYGTGSSSHAGSLSDTKTDFVGTNSKLNKLSSIYITDALVLTSAQKTQFKNFMWGITSGSGAATQQIEFRNLGLSLR